MGRAPAGPSHTRGFGLSQGHFRSKSLEPWESKRCPALAGGREGIAQGHAGEGIWAAGRGCPCLPRWPVALASAGRGLPPLGTRGSGSGTGDEKGSETNQKTKEEWRCSSS